MANKTKKSSTTPKSSNSDSGDENIVRIKASTTSSKKQQKSPKTTKTVDASVVAPAVASKQPRAKRPSIGTPKWIRAIGAYFKGAWIELRLVRWPDRRATWSLTGAVIVYSIFFVVLVLLLDAGFKYLFELILKK